ncbi:MAG: hypothetical protein HY397_01270, partial [Candidatus Doudnabacteria bacterium]|nr:hypothetical protein [Candidatus Doudnabacteria bacterium]
MNEREGRGVADLSQLDTSERFTEYFVAGVAAKFPAGEVPMQPIDEPVKGGYKGSEKWILFSPIEYARRGFIDANLIKRLKNGAHMLSVGVGPAYLERAIQRVFDIPSEQITLADKAWYKQALQTPFPKAKFDMTKPWPKHLSKFDIMLFPESFGAVETRRPERSALGTGHIVRRKSDPFPQSYIDASVYHILRWDDESPPLSRIDEYSEMVERDIPEAKTRLSILQSAIGHLNQPGQIRISGHLMNEQIMAYVYGRLKREYPEVNFTAGGKPIRDF